MKYLKNKKLLFVLVILISLAYFLALYYPANEPLVTDSIRIALGSERLLEGGELVPDFEVSGGRVANESSSVLYPPLQVTIALLNLFSKESIFATSIVFFGLVFSLLLAAVFLLMQKISGSSFVSFLAFLLALFSLPVLRASLLTPQNLLGYLFFVTIILLLLWKKGIQGYALAFGVLLLSFYFHHLSAVLATMFLTVYMLLSKRFKLFAVWLIVIIFLAGLLGKIVYGSLNPLTLVSKFVAEITRQNELFALNLNMPWDLPRALGLVFALAGILGLVSFFQTNNLSRSKKIVCSLFVVLVVLIGVQYLGFYYHPDRLSNYFFLPLLFGLPFFIKNLFELYSDKKRWCGITLMMILLSCAFAENVTVAKHELDYFGSSFTLTKSEKNVAEFLNRQAGDESILLSSRGENKKADSFAREVTTKDFLVYNRETSSLMPEREADISDEEFLGDRTFQAWLMIFYPDLEKSKQLFVDNNIKYVVTYRNSREQERFAGLKDYKVVFDNHELIVYERNY
ncbi:hypothetical protein KKC60_01000 [Patescibacteria group bacterium]|nr:hypothetical protein [Patescibacteria group bacterium]